MEKVTNEQWKQRKEQYEAYRKEVYGEYPEVEKFVRTKKRGLKFLLLMGLAMTLINAVFAIQMSGMTGMTIVAGGVAALIGFGPAFIFLVASMSSRWRISLVLYLLGFMKLMSLIEEVAKHPEIDSLGMLFKVYGSAFQQMPVMTLIGILSWIYAVLIILMAAWLTLSGRNRELAEQSELLDEKIKNFQPIE